MSPLTVPKPVDRGEWLRARHPYANASSIAALFDEHEFMTLADLTVEKLAAEPIEVPETAAMRRGRLMEPMLASWWEEEHGVALYEPDVMYVNGRVMATLDRQPVGNDDLGVECKSTSKLIDEPLPYWWWQAQAQMSCADLEAVDIAAYTGDHDFHLYPIRRDDDAIKALHEAAENFLASIDLGMIPEGVTLGWEHYRALHPVAEPDLTVELDDDGLALLVGWEQIRRVRLSAEKEEETAKGAVAALLGSASAAVYAGREVVTWRNNRDGSRMDWKAAALTLAEMVGVSELELIEAHTQPTPGARVLRPTKALLG